MNEIDIYKRQVELYKTSLDESQEILLDYKTRIDKAIEYINNGSYFDGSSMCKNDLLNILRGEDK